MKRLSLVLFFTVLLLAQSLGAIPGIGVWTATPVAADPPSIALLPVQTLVVEEAEAFVLSVFIVNETTGIMGYNMAVTFDSTVIRIVSVDEGYLPLYSGFDTAFYWLTAGETDSIHVNGAILGNEVEGPGQLFSLTFRAQEVEGLGEYTPVDFVVSEIRNDGNEPIAHTTTDAIVVVRQGDPTGVKPPPLASGAGLTAFPNPFNPTTTLVLNLSSETGGQPAENVSLVIYDAAGRLVRHVFDGTLGSGEWPFAWDGKNDAGNGVTSGVYFAVAKARGVLHTTRLVLVR